MAKQTSVVNRFNFIGGVHEELNNLNVPENTLSECLNYDLRVDGSAILRKSVKDEVATSVIGRATNSRKKLSIWKNHPTTQRRALLIEDFNSVTNTLTSIKVFDMDTEQDVLSLLLNTIPVNKIGVRIKEVVSIYSGIIVLFTDGTLYLVTAASGFVLTPLLLEERNQTYLDSGAQLGTGRRFYPSTARNLPTALITQNFNNYLSNLTNMGWTETALVNTNGMMFPDSVANLPAGLIVVAGSLLSGQVVADNTNANAGTVIEFYAVNHNNILRTAPALLGSSTVRIQNPTGVYTMNGLLTAAEKAAIAAAMVARTLVIRILTPTVLARQTVSYSDAPQALLDITGNKILGEQWNNTFLSSSVSPAPIGRDIIKITNPIEAIGFSNQRLWVSFNNKILYSRVAIANSSYVAATSTLTIAAWDSLVEDLVKMHQFNDPTSIEKFELLPDDGGSVVLPDTGNIYAMYPAGAGMLCFTGNGTWYVGGSAGEHFSADGYTVNKLNNIPMLLSDNPYDAFTEIPQGVVYMADQGLIGMSTSDGYSFATNDMTKFAVNKTYSALPVSVKKTSCLMYDDIEKEIHLYSGNAAGAITDILTYDTRIESWYMASFDAAINLTSVFVNQPSHLNVQLDSSLRFLRAAVIGTQSIAKIDGERDGLDVGLFPYSAALETSPSIFGDGLRDKRINYMTVYSQETENTTGLPSSTLAQVKFDWAVAVEAGKFTDNFEVYKLDKFLAVDKVTGVLRNLGFDVIHTKHNVMGAGRAIVIRFESGAVGTSSHILGYSLLVEGNSIV